MEISFSVGKKEITELVICRHWLTGRVYYFENGKRKFLKNALSLTALFTVALKKDHEFSVGNTEQHNVKVEHIKPFFFAGFRPHTFKVYIDGKFYKESRGY